MIDLQQGTPLVATSIVAFLLDGHVKKAEELINAYQPENEHHRRTLEYLKVWVEVEHQQWNVAEQGLDEFGPEKPKFCEVLTGRQRPALVLFRLGKWALILGSPYEAIHHLQRCMNMIRARRLRWFELMIWVCTLTAQAYSRRDMPLRAIEFLQQAVTLAKRDGDAKDFPLPYLWLSRMYLRSGNPPLAVKAGFKALQLAQAISNAAFEKRVRVHLGDCLLYLYRLQESREQFEQVLSSTIWPQDMNLVLQSTLSLTTLCLNLGSLTEAKRYAERLLTASERIGTVNALGKAYCTLGRVTQVQASYAHATKEKSSLNAESIMYYEQSLKYFEQTDDYEQQKRVCVHLARLLEDQGQEREALNLFLKAFVLPSSGTQQSACVLSEDEVSIGAF